MAAALSTVLMLVGGAFIFLGALGAVRLPDLLIRMQAATKASVLGASCTLLGAAIYHQDMGITARSLATITFICLTAPVAAHVIARAAYLLGAPLWEGTVVDELEGQYDPENRELRSRVVPSAATDQELRKDNSGR